MFTKKPLQGNSCASCEKNILNLYGQQADYYAWKRLPFREPNERIARFGQGFSKILSLMKNDDIQPNVYDTPGNHKGDPFDGGHHNQSVESGYNRSG